MRALTLGLLAASTVTVPHAQVPAMDTGLLTQPIPTQATYGSELRRGWQAGFNCFLSSKKVAEREACFKDAMRINILSHTTTARPFEVALYFEAWNIEIVAMESKVPSDFAEHAKIVEQAQYYFVQYIATRDDLDLTDDQVISALGMSKPIVGKSVAYWETHPEMLGPMWRDFMTRRSLSPKDR